MKRNFFYESSHKFNIPKIRWIINYTSILELQINSVSHDNNTNSQNSLYRIPELITNNAMKC